MFDQQVPWALGRRALIRWRIDPAGDGGHVSGWHVAIGVLEDLNMEVGRHDPLWVLDPSNEVDPPPEECVVEYRRLGGMERIGDRHVIATALVPGQCPRCFESTRPHAPGCMVVANLARGVPAFWAPWAMWEPHVHVPPNVRFHYVRLWNTDGTECNADELPSVALGPSGPTLSPWGQP